MDEWDQIISLAMLREIRISEASTPPKTDRIFNQGFVPINPAPRYGFQFTVFQQLTSKGWIDLHNHIRIKEISVVYHGSLPVSYFL